MTTQETNYHQTADVSMPGSGDTSAGAATAKDGYTFSIPSLTADDNAETPYNEAIVQCLLILARRGRAVREAQQAAAALTYADAIPDGADDVVVSGR